jgi:hypothetical protein
MLILRRREGQWVEITHRSGETVRVRVCNIRSRFPGQLDLAFDDPAHNFSIQRPERQGVRSAAATAEPTPAVAGPVADASLVTVAIAGAVDPVNTGFGQPV